MSIFQDYYTHLESTYDLNDFSTIKMLSSKI